ncbi:MAG: peptidyl-alpha-hydroxyglycine alpha-amidating lyase family protein [Planctomycetota bacterium]
MKNKGPSSARPNATSQTAPERTGISRRQFLTRTGGTVAGLAARPALPDSAVPPLSDTIAANRVNMVTWYEPDPLWPQPPAGFTAAAVPGVAVDAQGRVWTFTRSTPPVQVYDDRGRFLFAWHWPARTIKKAHYLRIDPHQNIWLADAGRHVVHKCDHDGRILLTLGTPDRPGQDENHFNGPTDIAVTEDGGVFVADGYGNARVAHFDPKGSFIRAWGNLPHAIALDSKGRLYVADRNNARIQVFDQNGAFLTEWRNIIVPWGLAIVPGDRIWLCGSSPTPWAPDALQLGLPPKDQLLMQFDTDGRLLQLWSLPMPPPPSIMPDPILTPVPGVVNWVHGIALDRAGNIYLGDIMTKRVQKLVRRQDPRAASQ